MSKLKLHIFGTEPHPDWKILDIEVRPEVDFVGDASNLSQFEDNSIEMIYAIQVLEHFYYGLNNELLNTLKEWHRVLEPEGKLLLSVPDLKTLCWLYSSPLLDKFGRLHLISIIFGGQTNQYDVHKAGFDLDILVYYADQAGFSGYTRVDNFGIFNACSNSMFNDILISLNIILTK